MNNITLYPEQLQAFTAVMNVWKNKTMKNPLVIMPTGTGKSYVIGHTAAYIAKHGGRVCLLTHREELINQDSKAISLFTNEPIGIYAAGLKRKDKKENIICAMIQSIGKKATKFDPFDVLMIDEAHLIPRKSNTMYMTFIKHALLMNPKLKIIGLTATHYRLGSGFLHKGDNAIFDGIAYELSVKQALAKGLMLPIVSEPGSERIDLSNVPKRGYEFAQNELEGAANVPRVTQAAVREILEFGRERKSCLMFAAGVKHALAVQREVRSYGIDCGLIVGDKNITSSEHRAQQIIDIKNLKQKYTVNCDILTTGFDAPPVDLIALLTSTYSVAKYIQTLGRETRLSPETGKINGMLLDYGGNVERHGFFDQVKIKLPGKGGGDAPVKMCPIKKCSHLLHASTMICSKCGYIFPPPEIKHAKKAYSGAVLSTDVKPEIYDVKEVSYRRHKKKNKPTSIKIDYIISTGNLGNHSYSEWLCPEHTGFARQKFEIRCLKEYKIKIPDTVEEFLNAAGSIPAPIRIRVKQLGQWPEIIGREY